MYIDNSDKILELQEENRALRTIIDKCRSVLCKLNYEWTYIKKELSEETINYYDSESKSESESAEDNFSFKIKVLNYFDEDDEFVDYLKINCWELNSKCEVKSIDYMISILAWVSWNNIIVFFHYCSDNSFSNFGIIELNGKQFDTLCPEYYIEMKCVMDSMNVLHNNDPILISKFHIFLAKLALFNNESEYNITEGNCYTFTNNFMP